MQFDTSDVSVRQRRKEVYFRDLEIMSKVKREKKISAPEPSKSLYALKRGLGLGRSASEKVLIMGGFLYEKTDIES